MVDRSNSMSEAIAAKKRLRDKSVADFKAGVKAMQDSGSKMSVQVNDFRIDAFELGRVLDYLQEQEALVHLLSLQIRDLENS